MPAIDLTARQRRTLRALDWLYDTTDGTRRTGRSMVLALSYLRRLVFQPPRGSQSEWLDVSDHVSNRQTDRMLTDEILRLADRLGLHDGIEVHMTRGQIRLRPGARISDSFRTAISEFGDLHDDELQPPPMPRRSVPIKKAPGKSTAPPAPVQTLWDYHLTAD